MMNCIIIEDSQGAIDHLENQLKLLEQELNILVKIDTVEDAVVWLKHNKTDIIFMDIQLGDSLSFEIFDHVEVKVPVIFTTAYDAYAIKAFEVNSIAYLLKPVRLQELKRAIGKYEQLYRKEESINSRIVELQREYQERFLVQTGNVMLPIAADSIAYFKISNGRHVVITCHDKQQFVLDNTLELLEKRLNPKFFFRINRQYIVNIRSVKGVVAVENGKLNLTLDPVTKEEVIVGRERAMAFKSWITQ
jgi:two-component system, LytTR family, response regulator LytT